MTRRSDGHGYGDDYGHGEADNVTEEFAAVANEDAFLDALAAGVDPSDGNDPCLLYTSDAADDSTEV